MSFFYLLFVTLPGQHLVKSYIFTKLFLEEVWGEKEMRCENKTRFWVEIGWTMNTQRDQDCSIHNLFNVDASNIVRMSYLSGHLCISFFGIWVFVSVWAAEWTAIAGKTGQLSKCWLEEAGAYYCLLHFLPRPAPAHHPRNTHHPKPTTTKWRLQSLRSMKATPCLESNSM